LLWMGIFSIWGMMAFRLCRGRRIWMWRVGSLLRDLECRNFSGGFRLGEWGDLTLDLVSSCISTYYDIENRVKKFG